MCVTSSVAQLTLPAPLNILCILNDISNVIKASPRTFVSTMNMHASFPMRYDCETRTNAGAK